MHLIHWMLIRVWEKSITNLEDFRLRCFTIYMESWRGTDQTVVWESHKWVPFDKVLAIWWIGPFHTSLTDSNDWYYPLQKSHAVLSKSWCGCFPSIGSVWSICLSLSPKSVLEGIIFKCPGSVRSSRKKKTIEALFVGLGLCWQVCHSLSYVTVVSADRAMVC